MFVVAVIALVDTEFLLHIFALFSQQALPVPTVSVASEQDSDVSLHIPV